MTFGAVVLTFVLCACAISMEAAPQSNAETNSVGSQEQLRYDVFREVPIVDIKPQGWLLEFLSRQNSGLTGHHDVMSYPFDTCLWAGLIPLQPHGEKWWRYEQTAYLSDGILRLGYLLGDEKLINIGQNGVEYLLKHPLPNNRLGHPFFTSQWPMAVYFRVMQAEYLAHHDPKLLEALRKHFLSYSVDDLTKGHRHIVNLEGMLWVYGLTGDKALLNLAEEAYNKGGDELPWHSCASPELVVLHGVTYMEEAKLPAILYSYTGKKEYLDASVNAFHKLERDHLLPDGVPSSNEYLAGKDPVVSHETCDISDYTWSLGYLLMATGDGHWADRIERAVFNAGPGCVSKDFHNLQYFSSVNQVIATGKSNRNWGSVRQAFGGTWMAYWPCHETECCAGNVHRFMPNYALRMWMRGPDGSIAATLYGPSRFSIDRPDGSGKLSVSEETAYPFSETVTFNFSTPGPTKTTFQLRIPEWCSKPEITVNGQPFAGALPPGKFVSISRTFTDGDKIIVRFPMEARLVHLADGGVFVERGPILYTYPVPEKVEVDNDVYPNLHGKKSSDPKNFPALSLTPDGPWNYALSARDAGDLRVVETSANGYPLDPLQSPLVIKVPARKVLGWTLSDKGFTPTLPASGSFKTDSNTEMITLVPYGSTRLRLTVFPEASLR